MSANMIYHVNRLRTTIDEGFESSREKSLALTKLDEVELWLTKAERKPETDFYYNPTSRYAEERDDVVHWFDYEERAHLPITTMLGDVNSLAEYDELVTMAMND